ncbi:hypothetical protein ZHAS_00004435 [Anopheles sinensis]|uniref:Uncharacterized protein n=1 Tax=Anopheles sinensis TaxID=74873 RepID=A0A084VGX7_ANOSI|nr:hypothetical protein ZHAS_00004435 [Anopheles sinensis]
MFCGNGHQQQHKYILSRRSVKWQPQQKSLISTNFSPPPGRRPAHRDPASSTRTGYFTNQPNFPTRFPIQFTSNGATQLRQQRPQQSAVCGVSHPRKPVSCS